MNIQCHLITVPCPVFVESQDQVYFFELVKSAAEWDFSKKGGFEFKMPYHKSEPDPWYVLCTAKLQEVIEAGRDAFAWQTRKEVVAKQKGNNFDQWLKPRQIALRPLLWEVCCDSYTLFKENYEKEHNDTVCFGVRQFQSPVEK